MKRLIPLLLTCALIGVGVSSCVKDSCISERTYVRWDPVFKTLEELRTDIKVEAPRELQNPGNLYYYQGFMLINEVLEGVHVIDNHDPENPENLAFIDIPGSRDMSVKDNILYVDSYLDLLAIDISSPTSPTLVHREEDIFQSYIPFNDEFGYIVEYVETEVYEKVNCDDDRWGGGGWWFRDDAVFIDVAFDFNGAFSNTADGIQLESGGGVGTGGSMARFTIAKNHLYALDQWQMQVFNVEQTDPLPVNKISMNWGIETLFPSGDYLFVGTTTGLLIFDNHDATAPYHLSTFEHAMACDPVFVSGDLAYVTLREGNFCTNASNQLDVIDISNIEDPRLIETYPMHHPHGLSVINEILYLCEGDQGLKVFDVENSRKIDENRLSHVTGHDAFDVIVLPPGDLVMVIGADGFYQYDASDPRNLKELSKISVNR